MIGKVMIFSLGVVIGVAGLAAFQLRMVVVAPVVASGQLEKSLDQLADAVQEAGGASAPRPAARKLLGVLSYFRIGVGESLNPLALLTQDPSLRLLKYNLSMSRLWHSHQSDPSFSLEEKIQAGGDGDEDDPDARVSPLPVELRHVFEIHAIYAGDKC